jgi:hypothetical protein
MYFLGEKPEHSESHWWGFRTQFMKRVANYDLNNYGPDNYNHRCNYSIVMCEKLLEFFDNVVNDDYKTIELFVNEFIEGYENKFEGYDWDENKYDLGYDDYMNNIVEMMFEVLSDNGICLCEFQWGNGDVDKLIKTKQKSKKK